MRTGRQCIIKDGTEKLNLRLDLQSVGAVSKSQPLIAPRYWAHASQVDLGSSDI